MLFDRFAISYLPHVELISVEYEEVDAGLCESVSEEVCKLIANSRGSKFMNIANQDKSGYPPGCYKDDGTNNLIRKNNILFSYTTNVYNSAMYYLNSFDELQV